MPICNPVEFGGQIPHFKYTIASSFVGFVCSFHVFLFWHIQFLLLSQINQFWIQIYGLLRLPTTFLKSDGQSFDLENVSQTWSSTLAAVSTRSVSKTVKTLEVCLIELAQCCETNSAPEKGQKSRVESNAPQKTLSSS